MKTTILDRMCQPGHARGRRGQTNARLGGLVLTLTVPCTCLKAESLGISNAVLLSWPEPLQEQIVVGADSLASNAVWTPWPQPIFKRFGALSMAVLATASRQFFQPVPGRQFADDFSDAWGPFTNRRPWTPWLHGEGEEWTVTNGVLRVDWHPPTASGFALVPLGTNVEANLRDVCTSVDILDWVTSGTNWSAFALAVRGKIITPTYGKGYFGGIGLNFGGVSGSVTPWINYGGPEVQGPSFDIHDKPPPYRLQFSVVGVRISLRVLSLTTGEVIREMSRNDFTLTEGFAALWFNGGSNGGDSFTITADNFFVTGTKP